MVVIKWNPHNITELYITIVKKKCFLNIKENKKLFGFNKSVQNIQKIKKVL